MDVRARRLDQGRDEAAARQTVRLWQATNPEGAELPPRHERRGLHEHAARALGPEHLGRARQQPADRLDRISSSR